MDASALPDVSGYGLLGAFLLLVVIFLAFGLKAMAHFKAVSDEWGRRNDARETVLAGLIERSNEVIDKNTGAWNRVEGVLNRLNGFRPPAGGNS